MQIRFRVPFGDMNPRGLNICTQTVLFSMSIWFRVIFSDMNPKGLDFCPWTGFFPLLIWLRVTFGVMDLKGTDFCQQTVLFIWLNLCDIFLCFFSFFLHFSSSLLWDHCLVISENCRTSNKLLKFLLNASSCKF